MEEEDDSSNPLEFKVALIFAGLFVIFTVLTHYTLIYAGTGGLNLLSFVSGFSDITPFILNLLQGTGSVAATVVMACRPLSVTLWSTCVMRFSSRVSRVNCARGYWADSDV